MFAAISFQRSQYLTQAENIILKLFAHHMVREEVGF